MADAFEFAVVGRGALAMSCTQQLLDRRLPVRALISSDPEVVAWAVQRGLKSGAKLQLLGDFDPGDRGVLLSVSNDRLIPVPLLERFPLAINFHDAPLPQYSGSHATSWALMAREKEYAISWHRMTSHADAGEILLRAPVVIAADETAFTLNGKCHDAALASFPQLIDAVLSRSLKGRPQNLAQRVFYPRDRRPERCAALDFRRPAHDMEALARALSCGDYVNQLGLPKLWTGHDFVVVRRVEIKAPRSRSVPGTVLALRGDAIEVATATHDVRLRDLASLDGEPLDASAVVQRYGLVEGSLLPSEGSALDEAIASAAACNRRDEEFWAQRLRELKPLALPAGRSETQPTELVVHSGRPCAPAELLAATAGWLARITGARRFDIGLADPLRRGALVAPVRPFAVSVDSEITLEALNVATADAYDAWLRRGPFLRDTVLRYPRIARPPGWKTFASWPVVVSFVGEPADLGAALHILIDPPAGSICLRTSAGAVSTAAVREMAGQLESLLSAMGRRPHVPLNSVSLPGNIE